MKRIVLLALSLAAFGVNSQQKLIATSSSQYDETGALQYIDSNEYIYNSWDGSLFSNEPVFAFDGAVFDWFYELPAISWDAENVYSGFSLPLSLNTTWNNTVAAGIASVSESASERKEYVYDAAGNLINQKYYTFNGATFDLSSERTFEFDANSNLVVEQLIEHSLAIPQVESVDSMVYDAANNLVQFRSFIWDGNSAFFASSESLISYNASSVVSEIELYQGNSSTPLEWKFDIDYVYTAGQPTNIIGYQVVGGVPETNPYVEINFTFGANNKIASYLGYVDGNLFQQLEYTYDGLGFITEIAQSEMNASSSSTFVAQLSQYYYQSTVGLDDVEIAEATIFPNPSNDFISISTGSPIDEVSIFGMNGSIMLTQTSGEINISNLPAGVYIAKVKTSTGSSQARFVKQ